MLNKQKGDSRDSARQRPIGRIRIPGAKVLAVLVEHWLKNSLSTHRTVSRRKQLAYRSRVAAFIVKDEKVNRGTKQDDCTHLSTNVTVCDSARARAAKRESTTAER